MSGTATLTLKGRATVHGQGKNKLVNVTIHPNDPHPSGVKVSHSILSFETDATAAAAINNGDVLTVTITKP